MQRRGSITNKPGNVYFLELLDPSKTFDFPFYKIGITTRGTEKRLINYDHKLISQCDGKLIQIYKFEQMLLKQYSHRKIDKDFDIYLDGMTEFLDLSDSEVLKIKSSIAAVNFE